MALQGKRQLQARLKAISHTETLLRRIQIRGVAEAKRLVPRRTGNLGRSIRVGTLSADSCTIVAGGTSKVGYAAAVELGTKAHVIVPRTKKVLAWGGGRTLAGRLASGQKADKFAMRVKHPGMKARPYLRPGLQAAANEEGIDGIVALWNGAA